MQNVVKPESKSRFAMVWTPFLDNLHNVITLSVIVQFG